MEAKQKRCTKLDIGLSDITNASKHAAALESDIPRAPRAPRAAPAGKVRKLERSEDTASSVQGAKLGTLANRPARLESPWLHFHSRKLRHPNIAHVLDALVTKGSLYLVFEDIRLLLEHFVVSPAYPTSLRLETILGQVSAQALHSIDARF